jgi:hemerythrin-like metal-binding protein
MTQPRHAVEGHFDAHHQLQGALVDAYEATLLDGAARQLAADTLGHLVDFTAVHFAEEERFMASRDYPLLELHRAAHGRLLEHLKEMEGEARVAATEVALAGVHRLRAWLLEHVDGPDRSLSAWRDEQPRTAGSGR